MDNLTSLSTLINRMNRWQSEKVISEQDKVRDLDEAIRRHKRSHVLPFCIKNSTIRVFPNVLFYPPADDHDYLLYLDTNDQTVTYPYRMRMRYTSLQQFYEDPDYRNLGAEIWQNNNLVLGIRDKNVPPGFLSGTQTLDDAQSTSNYTAANGASNLIFDPVLQVEGSDGSIQFTNTPGGGNADVSFTFTSFTDSNYQRKYTFFWVYLTHLPTSIILKYGANASNYLSHSVTTQFSGQPFQVNNWNQVAFDLNSATTTGTINTSTSWGYAAISMVGAAAGLYNVGPTTLNGWTELMYQYYSLYNIQTDAGTQPDRAYFMDDNGTYSLADSLIGSQEWADLVMYDAMLTGLGDKENLTVYGLIKAKFDEAEIKFNEIYPDMRPLEITLKYRYTTDYSNGWGSDYPNW